MLLQKIIINKLERPFLHRLATDKKYFEELSKYVEKNLKVDLEEFINSIYKSSGGDINFRDDNNKTALYPAFKNHNYSVIRLLESCGADVEGVKEELEKLFLHRLATDKKYCEELSKYVEKNLKVDLEEFINSIYKSSGGDINFRDDNNETALYPAFKNHNYSVIRLLESCGADVEGFKREVDGKISEEERKATEISLNNINNVSRITEAAHNITNVRDMYRYCDVLHNTRASVAAFTGPFVLAMVINTIKGNYYNGTYIPVAHYASDNFITDRVSTFVGFAFGVIAYKTIQALPQLTANISDLWHRRSESKHNESRLSRYKEIQDTVVEHISSNYVVER